MFDTAKAVKRIAFQSACLPVSSGAKDFDEFTFEAGQDYATRQSIIRASESFNRVRRIDVDLFFLPVHEPDDFRPVLEVMIHLPIDLRHAITW